MHKEFREIRKITSHQTENVNKLNYKKESGRNSGAIKHNN